MITEFSVKNYKSINNLSIKLGRINILIGENGCGKSNILEALVLASATSENKLDNEFLSSRGLRVTKPELMRSAFNIENTDNPISLEYKYHPNPNTIKYNLTNDNLPYSKWEKQLIS
ncbi:MAG TPA: AAA family ATPase, partial [Flavobacterium sp.]|nr:AAA family ATPase [Flavobacterium sp.]